jgi:hypothetical protein
MRRGKRRVNEGEARDERKKKKNKKGAEEKEE